MWQECLSRLSTTKAALSPTSGQTIVDVLHSADASMGVPKLPNE